MAVTIVLMLVKLSAVAVAVASSFFLESSTVVGAVLLMLLVYVVSDTTKPKNFPPGPPWLPIAGALPLYRGLVKEYGYQHLAMEALRKRYGDVVGLRVGRTLVVVVFGMPAVQAVLTREEYDARPDGYFYRLRCNGNRLGLVFTEGPAWVEQRRFTTQQLKKPGMGRSKMESLIQADVEDLIKVLEDRSKSDSPLPLHNLFEVAVVNSLWAVISGRRFSTDDPNLAALLESLKEMFRNAEISGGLLNNMPFLRFIAPEWSGYTRSLKNFRVWWSFIRKTIDEHMKTRVNGQARDLTDAFLEEAQKSNTPNSSFTEKQLLALAMDLLMAGAETTINTLGFAMLHLLRNSDVLRRVQEQIDFVVGRHRHPQLSDRPRLPYLEAVIMETQRVSNVPPLGLPHRALVDTQLNGYRIPKDTTVITSLYSVHMDEVHWKNPEQFNPSRFLDEHGRLNYNDYFIPFGLGKRRCLGESLARANLFLLLASLLHKFRIAPVPESPPPAPGDDSLPGITLSPKPFYGQLTPRD